MFLERDSMRRESDGTASQGWNFRERFVVSPKLDAEFQSGRAHYGVGQFQMLFSPKLYGSGANRWSQLTNGKLFEKPVNFLFFLRRK